ncbi:kinase-like domain-containing protein [Chaetomidium leptoderma]|uniref:Kinase-like domain-containing protein n=1 Tax=Chaetomidium leptoderma TaxID=669021 RepID=A0AAN6VHB9_9PEZI|nr:kinase-like domain-containing protein [Chaetomidium leptoderma]
MSTTKPEEPLKEEEGCFAVTCERKYYHRGGSFVKRNLRPKEYRTGARGLVVPRLAKERLRNEAESLRYIRQHTDIPVPAVYSDFEDDDAYYLVTEYVEGVNMADLSDEQKVVVRQELEGYLAKLKTLRSNRIGGPSGIVIPPYRVMRQTKRDDWDLRASAHEEYVFCHNDLSQHNVLVDPETLRITGIVDWEYAGFYPAHFEMPFYTRIGPSVALKDEVDDSVELLALLESKAEDAVEESTG